MAHPETDSSERIIVDTGLGPISLEITSDLASLKDLWETLQATAPCTSAQTYDWAQAWTKQVLVPEGGAPVIVVGYGEDGAALFLWPFEIATKYGAGVLKWLGQDHANYNMGLFTPEASQGLVAEDISNILRIAASDVGAAAAVFDAQPITWDGVDNPFAQLSHQRSPNSGYAIKLGDFKELYEELFSKRSRSTLDRKGRRLADLGTVEFGWAETPDEKQTVLEEFFAQKAQQFAAMGVTNMFDAHARAFYGDVARLEGDNPSRLRLGYVKLNGDVLAIFIVTVCHGRMIVALSSIADGETQRQSPGGLLLRHQIAEACEEGLAYYDLGVGKARHKDEWSTDVQALFDSFIAFKPQGQLLTLVLANAARLKSAIKSNRHLWSLAQKVRKRLAAIKG